MMWRVASAILALLLVAALVPAIRHLREVPPAPEPPLRLELTPRAGTIVGGGIDQPLDSAFAPSGQELVFVATQDGETALWRRRMDAQEPTRLAGTDNAAMPAFSPDGSRLWFFANGVLRRLDLATGETRDIAEAPAPGGVSVRDGDEVLFGPGPPGPIVRLANGVRTEVTHVREGERAHLFPAWTDDGDAFTYLAIHDDGRRTIRLRTLAGQDTEDVELRGADSHGIVAAGRLVYVREATLLAERLDPDTRRLAGRAVTLAANVGVAPDGRGAFAVSDRLLAWGPPASQARVIQWVDLETGERRETIAEPGDYWQVRLSPDGRAAAVTARDPLLRTLDVFTMDARGGPLLRLTRSIAADTDPVWSPDGRRIAFRSLHEGAPQVFVAERGDVAAHRDVAQRFSAASNQQMFTSPFDEIPTDWTPDGLVFHARGANSGFDIVRVRPGSAAQPLAHGGFNERDGRVSPDGHWLAYASDESGRYDIYVARLDGAARTRVSTAGGERPRWIAGGNALLFLRGGDLMRVDLGFDSGTARATVPARVLGLPGLRDYAVAPGGRRVLAILPAAPEPPGTIAILSNWRYLIN